MQFQYHAQIDQGRMRPYNEDAAIALPQCGFFAVSDGMGGLPRGKDTSRYVVQCLNELIPQYWAKLEEIPAEQRPEYAKRVMTGLIRGINEQIYKAGNDRGRAIFGATLAAAWFVEDQVIFANVGDSRGYQLLDGKLERRSEDHNVAAILVEIGQLTVEQAKDHPTSCQLTQFMGSAPEELFPAVNLFDAPAGSGVLLCSDGLYGMLEEEQLTQLAQGDPAECCAQLIDAANQAGGRDNISAVIAICGEGENTADEQVVLYAEDGPEEEQPEAAAADEEVPAEASAVPEESAQPAEAPAAVETAPVAASAASEESAQPAEAPAAVETAPVAASAASEESAQPAEAPAAVETAPVAVSAASEESAQPQEGPADGPTPIETAAVGARARDEEQRKTDKTGDEEESEEKPETDDGVQSDPEE
ncbi:MAG: protein phosphatase 2C domain-containing protein [Butyricicoccaceae bacterium]